MFKAPFSFEGRIRRIEYLLSALLGGLVTAIAFWLGVGTALFGAASGSGSGFGFGMLLGFVALFAGTLVYDCARREAAARRRQIGLVPVVGVDSVGQHRVGIVHALCRRDSGTEPLWRRPEKPDALPSSVG